MDVVSNNGTLSAFGSRVCTDSGSFVVVRCCFYTNRDGIRGGRITCCRSNGCSCTDRNGIIVIRLSTMTNRNSRYAFLFCICAVITSGGILTNRNRMRGFRLRGITHCNRIISRSFCITTNRYCFTHFQLLSCRSHVRIRTNADVFITFNVITCGITLCNVVIPFNVLTCRDTYSNVVAA